jgi:competence protein ComEC
MRSAILAFAAGIFLLQQQPALLPWSWLAVLALLAALACAIGYWLRWRGFPLILARISFCLATATAGFAWASGYAHLYLAQELPQEWENKDITLIGTIDSLPFRFEQGVRFNFAVEQALPQQGLTPVVPAKLALSWYAGVGESKHAVGDVQPGERWQLTVKLKRPHGNANPDGFDYEVWLLEQGLRATGGVRTNDENADTNRRLNTFVWSFGNAVDRSRAWLRQRIEAALPGKPYAGVLVALVIGDQREVPQSDWKVFNRTGIGHLISISGLHITMVAGLFAGLMQWLWRHSFFTRAQLPLFLPAQKVAALAGALAAFSYVSLAGFGVPAQRTLYMLAVVALAMWSGRLTSISHTLCLALLAALLLDPWAVLWPGFWLSFGAVGILLFAGLGRVEPEPVDEGLGQPRWRTWLAGLRVAGHTQYVATVGLVPLTLLLFGQFSLVSPLANAVAIPLVSFVVTPLALAGSVMPAPLSVWLLSASHACVAVLADVLTYLSGLPMAVWLAPLPPAWTFVAAMLGTLWLLAPRGMPLRWAGLLCWLPILCNQVQAPAPGQMQVTAFDVGQGMAVLVETAGHRLLYDTGPYYSPDSDGGSRVILPYLQARGINSLDGMVISHNDNDHSGGALSLLGQMPVGWLASSLALTSPIVRKTQELGRQHIRCQAGQHWEWDGIQFDMLQPEPVSYESSKWKPNARSCLLKITHGKQALLLPGDIEAIQEDELINGIPGKLHATVMLAPHHGSGTSSTEAFLRAVAPQYAIFQVGYLNRFHHPKPEVYARYASLGINRLRTDDSGAVLMTFGDTLEIQRYREQHARYWYGR